MAQKYRSITASRQGTAYYFAFTGEDADYVVRDSLAANWAEDGQTLYFEYDPKAWDAMADGYKVISHWGSRHLGEICESQRLQARINAKLHRERTEAQKREAALAEAAQLRESARASEQAAKDAEKRAAALETANTA